MHEQIKSNGRSLRHAICVASARRCSCWRSAAAGLTRFGAATPLDRTALDGALSQPAAAADAGRCGSSTSATASSDGTCRRCCAQLAGARHGYESQLGWGATLKAHWGDDADRRLRRRERASALSRRPRGRRQRRLRRLRADRDGRDPRRDQVSRQRGLPAPLGTPDPRRQSPDAGLPVRDLAPDRRSGRLDAAAWTAISGGTGRAKYCAARKPTEISAARSM